MRFALILLTVALAAARLINVTIDDAFGDPTTGEQIQYSPSDAWQRGDGCQPCTAKPTPASDAWLGTWHDASFNPNDTATNSAIGQIIEASVQFTGTAVYINCILTRSSSSPDGNSDMTFFIDDVMAGVFQQTPDGDTTYDFDVPVFATTGLPNSQHTVRLESGHAGKKALVLLDSIVYTTDDGIGDASSPAGTSTAVVASSATSSTLPQSNTKKDSNVGVIVGPIVAALVVVIGFIVGLLIAMRRRRRGKSTRSIGNGLTMITPFEQHPVHMQQAQVAFSAEGSSSLSPCVEDFTSSTGASVHKPGTEFSRNQGVCIAAEKDRWSRPLPTISSGARRAAPTGRTPSTPSGADPGL